MKHKIKSVVVLGSSGTMGSLTGGIIAQNGIKVYFLSRNREHSETGLRRAINQSRSEIISKNIVCGDYDSLLKSAIESADWVVECVSEDMEIKHNMYKMVEKYKKPDSIISSMTSSLPLSKLCQERTDNFRRHFLGIHFYNPPGKLIACEIASISDTNPMVVNFMIDFLQNRLGRVVIPVRNIAAYAGNRIGFLFFSQITELVKTYGVEMMDYLMGPYTGRIMPALATIDLIGLDIYKAIIRSLYENTNGPMHEYFVLPEYIIKMVEHGLLGYKTPEKAGFYKKDKNGNKLVIDPVTLKYSPIKKQKIDFVEKAKEMIHVGRYLDAFEIIKKTRSEEADIVRKILCTYIAYSYSCIGEVTDARYGINGIDKVMAFGYNWAPPSLLLHLLGGLEAVKYLLQEYDLIIPESLDCINDNFNFPNNFGRFIIAR